MIIQGHFVGDAPYFTAHIRTEHFKGKVWLLADTGASHTTLLDRSIKFLNIPMDSLKPDVLPVFGIGGSINSFIVRNADITFVSDEGDFTIYKDICVVKHDLKVLSPKEYLHVLRIPSLLGRDILNQFRLIYDYPDKIVQLIQND